MTSRASLDLEGGHVQFAAQRVRVRALDDRGHVQVGDDDGPVLRPPTFGERTRLVTSALGSAHPARRLAAALATALCTRAGSCDPVAERVVALLLAGAGDAGPPLVDTACLVARASGSPLDAVESLQATTVDFYARRLTSDAPADDGWHRVVLADGGPDAAGAAKADEDTIVMELAEVLLDRARAWSSAEMREAAAGPPGNGAFAAPSSDDSDAREHHTAPDEPGAVVGGDTARNPGADAAPPRRHPHETDMSRATSSMNAARPPSPATEALLRFRQAPFRATSTRKAEGDATTTAPGRADGSPIGETQSPPVTPSRSRSTTDRIDWQPSEWTPGPWRLDRRDRSPLVVPQSASARLGSGWPTPTPNATGIAAVSTSLVAARTAEELADAVADSLRREATRRGLVP